MKKKMVLAVSMVMAMSLMAACGESDDKTEAATEAATVEEVTEADSEEEVTEAEVTEEVTEEAADASSTDGEWEYGEFTYTGDDNIIYAIDFYMCDELAKGYDGFDVSIPVVIEVSRDDSNPDDIKVWGDFWLENYKLEGDTLECVSGGNYPGCFHIKTTDAGCGYEVTDFEMVADGGDFDASAKEIFGERYDAFMEVYSNDEVQTSKRKETIADYVSSHNVPATQYKDFGSDPISLSE